MAETHSGMPNIRKKSKTQLERIAFAHAIDRPSCLLTPFQPFDYWN
jgi:hypothetical protein